MVSVSLGILFFCLTLLLLEDAGDLNIWCQETLLLHPLNSLCVPWGKSLPFFEFSLLICNTREKVQNKTGADVGS